MACLIPSIFLIPDGKIFTNFNKSCYKGSKLFPLSFVSLSLSLIFCKAFLKSSPPASIRSKDFTVAVLKSSPAC